MVDEVVGPPPNYVSVEPSWESVYSNMDHHLDRALADRMKAEPLFARHAAWNFNAVVWYEPEPALWHSVVRRYGAVVAHFTGVEIMDVVRPANERFGSE